jgi:putative ABC transport system ATP-binding protein
LARANANAPRRAAAAAPAALALHGLWHVHGELAAPAHFEGAREEVLDELQRLRAPRSFVLHVPRLELRPGSITCIVGSSGCGKTTLLSILGLLRAPTYAERFALALPELGGEELLLQRGRQRAAKERVDALRRRHVGFALQAGALIGALPNAKNLVLPLLAADARSARAELEARVHADLLGLFPAQDDAAVARLEELFPAELSGGQAQRMLLARALVARPALLFADEPTNNLDPFSARAAVEALLARREELAHTTVVMVTHDRSLAASYGFDLLELATSPERPWFGTLVESAERAVALATPVVPPSPATPTLPKIAEPPLAPRAGALAALSIEEALRAPAQLVSFVLTLLCLALPLLTLLGLEAGALRELARRVKESPHLARLVVWPPSGGNGVDRAFLDTLRAKHPAILRVEPGLTRTVRLRFRRAGHEAAAPFFLANLPREEASALAARLGVSPRDRLRDEFELLWPNGAGASGEATPLAALDERALAVALHADQAQKLLGFARACDPAAFPPELAADDPSCYLEAAVPGRGGATIAIPLRIARIVDEELGRSPQIAYVSRALLEALTWDQNGYPASLDNDSGFAPERAQIELFGFPSRAEAPDPLHARIWVHARSAAWLEDPAVRAWLAQRELQASTAEGEPLIQTCFGIFDRTALEAGGGMVFTLQRPPGAARFAFGDAAEEELLSLAAAAGATITLCPIEPPLDLVRDGGESIQALGVPFPRFDASDARRANDARLLELTSARVLELQEGGAPGRNGFFDHPVFQREVNPSAPELVRDPFYALATPKLERELGAERGALELGFAGAGGTFRYPLRALHRRAIRLQDPTSSFLLVPVRWIGLDHARRAGRVEFQRDPDHGPLFRRARDPERDLVAPFASVYPRDVTAIPAIEAALEADYDVRAPGALRVRELARNAELLGAITRIVYWTTFAAAIAALFLVTALHERTKRRQTGVLALLGLPPRSVLWMVSARHAFALLLAALAIALVGFLRAARLGLRPRRRERRVGPRLGRVARFAPRSRHPRRLFRMNRAAPLSLSALISAALALASCGGSPEPQRPRPSGRIYSAEEVQREAQELVVREAEARARFLALSALRERLVARGLQLDPLPSSPGLPTERHVPTSGLSEQDLAERMARLRKANEDLERFVPRLDRLRAKLLGQVDASDGDPRTQLDAIERAGIGTLRVALHERELSLELVYVPPGRGVLGIDLDDPELPHPLERRGAARVTSSPLVELVMTEGYFLQRGELTRAELATLRGLPAPEQSVAALPATQLTWREGLEIAAALQHPQLVVRLPSEVEWEYAARCDPAGKPRFYPWGGPRDAARESELARELTTAEHAGVDRSALGFLHLAGNAREWTLDAWRERRWQALAPLSVHHPSRLEVPKETPPLVAVRGAAAGEEGPLRRECAFRAAADPSTCEASIGLRLVVLRR